MYSDVIKTERISLGPILKLRLKRPMIIPAGTIFEDIVPDQVRYNRNCVAGHTVGIGRNATADVYVGAEPGDPEFDDMFEVVQ